MSDDLTSRVPLDRSFDAAPGHLLPMAQGERKPLLLDRGRPEAIEWAAQRLAAGGVVALPTDTVYGIAASLAHPEALARLFAIKGRPRDNPVPILLASAAALDLVATDVPAAVRAVAARFWPGPLTVVVPARAGIPDGVLGPDGTVGVRVPNHPVVLPVIEQAGGAIAATSANRTGDPPAQTASEVLAALGNAVDLILDGGVAPGGIASTVVRFTDDGPRLLRRGALAIEDVVAAWRAATAAEGMGESP
ncbi:MAG: Threonylcarbamoyl-AMP synthase [uncultured Thermomicrobiales bacterium]|uniref:L-threonylcarbamoyladenylate synthase n=1 Tax=uncultured Thermomicrobiales bacterium TaxID=1645740 RepID=A0A6J4UZA0_9BACT|nr:MAG: Threonylcarbamoyl-AMP synthase [uncultured Thermomicrobiales bacterium]